MNGQLNLKEIERRAFQSTYQDGLWDMLYGLIVIGMSIFVYRPPEGYSVKNIILSLIIIILAQLFFQLGKRFITLPRLGQVRFGPTRQRKNRNLAIILAGFILVTVVLVVLTAVGWWHPSAGGEIESSVDSKSTSLLVVSAVAALILGSTMIVIAFFSDFTRGYFIAVLMALAVYLMIYLNQPIYPIIIGVVILLPGVVLFLRFLKVHPLPNEDGSDA